MKVKDLVEELDNMKKYVGDENWKGFQDTNVFVYIDGKSKELEIIAVCGLYLEYGLEAVIQNKRDDK